VEQITTKSKEQKISVCRTINDCKWNKNLGRGTPEDYMGHKNLVRGTIQVYKEGTKIVFQNKSRPEMEQKMKPCNKSRLHWKN
jgi:hypothetical protein